MRIAFVYDTVYPESKGGVERRVWELATRLTARGHEIHLLVPKYWDGEGDIVRDGVVLRGVSRQRDLHTKLGRRAVKPAIAHALGVLRLLRAEHFDLVDCQIPAYPAAVAAWLASLGKESVQVITWHEAWGRHWFDEMGLIGLGGRLVEGQVARLPCAHIAVSQDTASKLNEIGGSAVEVIPPGVDLSDLNTVVDQSLTSSDILFVGRLVPTKNLGLLVEAIARLENEGIRTRVVVVGDGPTRQRWEKHVRDRNLEQSIRFVGTVDAWAGVIAYLRSTKVFALPSLREGYSMIALEAAACGVPVVTVDHRRNAARHVVDHGSTGFVVRPDPDNFAMALKRLLTDEDLREELGDRAKEKAQHSDWDAVVARTEALYSRFR